MRYIECSDADASAIRKFRNLYILHIRAGVDSGHYQLLLVTKSTVVLVFLKSAAKDLEKSGMSASSSVKIQLISSRALVLPVSWCM